MTPERAKEQFSFAYITAVASHARLLVELRRLDDDGIDGTLISDVGTEPRIEFQAKSTSEDVERDDHIAYPLKVANYNKLVKPTTVPRILIVVIIPHEIHDWLDQNNNRLLTRHCAYWVHLQGGEPSANRSKKTVTIPKDQIFSPKNLAFLMNLADTGGLDV